MYLVRQQGIIEIEGIAFQWRGMIRNAAKFKPLRGAILEAWVGAGQPLRDCADPLNLPRTAQGTFNNPSGLQSACCLT